MELIKKAAHGIAWRIVYVGAEIYKFLTLKLLYPSVYRREARQPVDEQKIVFLEVRLAQLTDNFRLLYDRLKEEGGYQLSVCHVGYELESKWRQCKNSLAVLREIARARYVFINDSSALISCIALRPQTKVIQTWHACGAFKKFGFSTAEKQFGGNYKQLTRYPLHKNFSLVTVSSPEVIWAYAEAFHMEERREDIAATGISRTDIFYDRAAIAAAYENVHRLMPESAGKKIILYAPTFRGRVKEAYSPEELDIAAMREALKDEYVLVFKHHPFVKKRPQVAGEFADFAKDLTEEMAIEELLMVSDICISDYSSLVFEYSLFERPMLFFAYDLQEYYDWRGFYYEFEEMTPGPICRTTQEVIAQISDLAHSFDRQRVTAFKNKFMSACDGHATERILQTMKDRFES